MHMHMHLYTYHKGQFFTYGDALTKMLEECCYNVTRRNLLYSCLQRTYKYNKMIKQITIFYVPLVI